MTPSFYNKAYSYIMKTKILLFLLLITACGSKAQKTELNDIDVNQLRKLQMAQMAISELYVDSVDQEKLTEDAIKGMLNQLDPHSSYTDPKETKQFNEPLKGNFEGIGVQFNLLKDTLIVVKTIAKGPSEKVGIMAGDRIITVNDTTIAGVKMQRDSIVSLLRGPKGSHAHLGIIRRGAHDVLKFDVVRDKIPLNTIDAAYMLRPGTGYIHLNSFGSTSGKEVDDAIKKLKSEGMKELIFDLSQNGGGYLGAAVDVASQFLPGGSLIVYTEGRTQPRSTLYANSKGLFHDGKLIIIVDELTASAAEIVTGAVQDHDRGTVVGRRTFGKGLVQRPLAFHDGSMIRLTTAHYYTPSGRCIQKPYVKGEKEAYNNDIINRFNHKELFSIDSIHIDSSKVYQTLVKKRKVYGGGGIMPDVFVPLDTSKVTTLCGKFRKNNIVINMSLKYVDTHRKELLKHYKGEDDFIENFNVPNSLINEAFAEGAKKKLLPTNQEDRKQTTIDLRRDFRNAIIYNLYDRNAYFKCINENSDVVKTALKVLDKN